ncbi:hypothetical protein VXM60_01685 [Shewanella khirikhana]|uniref:hypothetical protein n=1 Tax=Shewanella khirikhana TaxID=1965282 RepID=UPI0030D02674
MKRIVVVLISLFFLSGCFNSHLDCNNENNIKEVEKHLSGALDFYLKSIFRKDPSSLDVKPKFSISNYKQTVDDNGVRKCECVLDVALGEHNSNINVSFDVLEIDNLRKVNNIIFDKARMLNLSKISISESEMKPLRTGAKKYGFKSPEAYRDFLKYRSDYEFEKNSLQVTVDMMKSAGDEARVIDAKIKQLQERLDASKEELKKALSKKATFNFDYLKNTKISIDSLNLNDFTMLGKYENNNFYDSATVSLNIYLYKSDELSQPFASNSINETSNSFRFSREDKIRPESVGFYSSSETNGKFKTHLNKEFVKTIKRKLQDTNTSIDEIQALIVPVGFSADKKYETLGKDSYYRTRFDLPSRIESTISQINALKRDFHDKSKIVRNLTMSLVDKTAKISDAENKALELSPNNSLELVEIDTNNTRL